MIISGRVVDKTIRTDEVLYFVEEHVAYNIIYYGRTEKFTTLDTDALWQVKRVTLDGLGIRRTEYANHGKYNCVWSDRATYFAPAPPPQGPPPAGSFTVSSEANVQGRISVVNIDNLTWTPLPAVPLAARKGASIINYSGQQIKINYDNSIVGYVGAPIEDQADRNYDIGPAIVVYAKSATSACAVIIEELS